MQSQYVRLWQKFLLIVALLIPAIYLLWFLGTVPILLSPWWFGFFVNIDATFSLNSLLFFLATVFPTLVVYAPASYLLFQRLSLHAVRGGGRVAAFLFSVPIVFVVYITDLALLANMSSETSFLSGFAGYESPMGSGFNQLAEIIDMSVPPLVLLVFCALVYQGAKSVSSKDKT